MFLIIIYICVFDYCYLQVVVRKQLAAHPLEELKPEIYQKSQNSIEYFKLPTPTGYTRIRIGEHALSKETLYVLLLPAEGTHMLLQLAKVGIPSIL
ncbi:hypothetical protein BD408DRAFT_183412 [Parasitella parasitica]|nr:hypothetical protein BD408DRAFT_183412 [Parasitella parasitica]